MAYGVERRPDLPPVVHRNFQLAPRDNRVRLEVMTEMGSYVDWLLQDRLVDPAGDMLTTPRGAPSDRVCGTSPGIHRCVGSNLARLELLVALQEWLRAFPNYRLDESRPTTWANGQVRGPRNIPVLLA